MNEKENKLVELGIQAYVEVMNEFEEVSYIPYYHLGFYWEDNEEEEYREWKDEMRKLYTKKAENAARTTMTFALKTKADEKLVRTAIRKAKLQIKHSYYL